MYKKMKAQDNQTIDILHCIFEYKHENYSRIINDLHWIAKLEYTRMIRQ